MCHCGSRDSSITSRSGRRARRAIASTLSGYLGTVVANAAIVSAGTNGSINVFASQNPELIIDINGYYAPQSGITLQWSR
jgi:hypothetical protein